jgi:Flp pilus assembly protein TadD
MGRIPIAFMVLTAGCATAGLHPEAVEHNRVGADLFQAGKLDQAEARFRLALEFHARFAEPRANLGLVSLARGDLEAAEHHLRGAVTLNEDFALAWANLGVVLDRQGRLAAARSAYQQALSIDPAVLDARRNLAVLHLRKGELALARAQLMRLSELRTDAAEIHALLGYTELRLGRRAEADARIEQSLAIDRQCALALVARGIALAFDGEFDAAIADLTRASTDPSVGDQARLRLVAVYLASGDRVRARRLLGDLRRRGITGPALAHLSADPR